MKSKDRRHSGWYTPGTTLSMSYQEMRDECLEPCLQYDEWSERRDGMRSPFDDSKIRPLYCWLTRCNSDERLRIKAMNAKHKRHAMIRKLRRYYKESPPPYLV